MSFTLHTEETTNAPTKQEWMEDFLKPFAICEKKGCGESGEPEKFYQTDAGDILCKTCLDKELVLWPDMTYEKYQI